MDKDALVSACILLKRARVAGGIADGSPAIEAIKISPEPGYETLAFAIPELLAEWSCVMREFAMDSSCELSQLNLAVY
jgi:hypothetical protein